MTVVVDAVSGLCVFWIQQFLEGLVLIVEIVNDNNVSDCENEGQEVVES